MSFLSKVSHDLAAAITQTRRVQQYLLFSTARPNNCLRKDKGRGTPPPPRKHIGADEVGGVLRQEDPHTQSLPSFALNRPRMSRMVDHNRTPIEQKWSEASLRPNNRRNWLCPALESHARQGPDNPPNLQMSMSLIPESTAFYLGGLGASPMSTTN